MQRALVLGAALALGGCGSPRDFVGDDLGSTQATAGSNPNSLDLGPMESLPMSDANTDLFALCMAEPPAGQQLQLSAVPQAGVLVHHEGMRAPICHEWEVRAEMYGEAGVIEVFFDDVSGADCDRGCGWAFEFLLYDVPPGKWQVRAGTETADVDVL